MTRGYWILFAALTLAVVAALLSTSGGSLAGLPAEQAFQSPSLLHPFGTDDLGRDMLQAILLGAHNLPSGRFRQRGTGAGRRHGPRHGVWPFQPDNG